MSASSFPHVILFFAPTSSIARSLVVPVSLFIHRSGCEERAGLPGAAFPMFFSNSPDNTDIYV